MITQREFANMVKYARRTGYVTHDIRDPELYASEADQNNILDMDKAFIDAANDLKLSFELAAGYGESDQARADTDELTFEQVTQDDQGRLLFKPEDVYRATLPFFKVKMKMFVNGLKSEEKAGIERYWMDKA